MTDRILVVAARTADDTLSGRMPLALGVARLHHDGWRFMPFTSARKASRKGHKTWEASLPRWTGGLNGTESIKMLSGESLKEAAARIAERSIRA